MTTVDTAGIAGRFTRFEVCGYDRRTATVSDVALVADLTDALAVVDVLLADWPLVGVLAMTADHDPDNFACRTWRRDPSDLPDLGWRVYLDGALVEGVSV